MLKTVLKNYLLLVMCFCAITFLQSCEADENEMTDLSISLTSHKNLIEYKIHNLGNSIFYLADAGYEDVSWPPTDINIRLANESEEVYLNQTDDPHGWWTPHYIRSTLSFEPQKKVTLRPKQSIVSKIELPSLLRGMRIKSSMPKPSFCKYQIRARVNLYDNDDSKIVMSKWKKIACAEMLEVHWK